MGVERLILIAKCQKWNNDYF